MPWNYFPLTFGDTASDTAIWQELIDAINERCTHAGISGLASPSTGDLWLTAEKAIEIQDKVEELVPYFYAGNTPVTTQIPATYGADEFPIDLSTGGTPKYTAWQFGNSANKYDIMFYLHRCRVQSLGPYISGIKYTTLPFVNDWYRVDGEDRIESAGNAATGVKSSAFMRSAGAPGDGAARIRSQWLNELYHVLDLLRWNVASGVTFNTYDQGNYIFASTYPRAGASGFTEAEAQQYLEDNWPTGFGGAPGLTEWIPGGIGVAPLTNNQAEIWIDAAGTDIEMQQLKRRANYVAIGSIPANTRSIRKYVRKSTSASWDGSVAGSTGYSQSSGYFLDATGALFRTDYLEPEVGAAGGFDNLDKTIPPHIYESDVPSGATRYSIRRTWDFAHNDPPLDDFALIEINFDKLT